MPSSRPNRGDRWLQPVLNDFVGHLDKEDRWVLLAMRGYYLKSMGRPTANDFNIYDDALFELEVEDGKILRVESFNFNTDPSREYSPHLAHLKCLVKGDEPYRYKTGLHGYNRPTPPYKAFVQAESVTVLRDGKTPDSPQYEDTGRFGINIHKGGDGTTSSLGCQTVPPEQWRKFQEDLYRRLADAKQKTIPYILVFKQG